MLYIKIDRIQMQGIAPIEPGEGLAQPDQMLIALQNHHKGQFMGHEMFSYNFVAIFAFSASGVSLQLLFLYIIVDSVTVMNSNRFHIYFFVLGQDESSSINVPPISSLIFNEITDKLSEGYLQIVLYEFGYIANIAYCLLQIFLAIAFDCIEGFGHFSVDYKFADFIHFLIGSVGVV